MELRWTLVSQRMRICFKELSFWFDQNCMQSFNKFRTCTPAFENYSTHQYCISREWAGLTVFFFIQYTQMRERNNFYGWSEYIAGLLQFPWWWTYYTHVQYSLVSCVCARCTTFVSLKPALLFLIFLSTRHSKNRQQTAFFPNFTKWLNTWQFLKLPD